MEFVIAAIVVWALIGLGVAVASRRAGHNLAVYATIGIILGPLAFLFLARAMRHPEIEARTVRTGVQGGGWIDVLVGVDGSEWSAASAAAVVDTLGHAVRRLGVARVLDAETAERPTMRSDADHARVRATFAVFEPHRPELIDLGGRADSALIDHARVEGYDVIVIGHPRTELARLLFGSTATRLIGGSHVPVIVGGPPPGEDDGTVDASGAERDEELNVR